MSLDSILAPFVSSIITHEMLNADKYIEKSEQMFRDFNFLKIKTEEDFLKASADHDIFAINSSLEYPKSLVEYAIGNYSPKLTDMIYRHLQSIPNSKKFESYTKQMRYFVLLERKRVIKRLLWDDGITFDINQDYFGYSVLHFAIMNGCSLDFLKFLIKCGANLSAKENHHHQTVLFFALRQCIAQKNFEMFEYLVNVASSTVIDTLDLDGNHILGVFNILRYSTDVFATLDCDRLNGIAKILYTETKNDRLFEIINQSIDISNKKNQDANANLIEILRSEIQQSNKTIKDLKKSNDELIIATGNDAKLIATLNGKIQQSIETIKDLNDELITITVNHGNLIKTLNAEIQQLIKTNKDLEARNSSNGVIIAESQIREKLWRREVHRLLIRISQLSRPSDVPMVEIPFMKKFWNGEYCITVQDNKKYGSEWSECNGQWKTTPLEPQI